MPSTALTDRFGRTIDYLRVSVTDRCDLRCSYCLPKGFKDFAEPAHWLTHAEMHRLVGLFIGLGVRRVRLTGGEPLLRRGIVDLAGMIAATPGLADLSLSTNATQLAKLAEPLKTAGVSRLNVSLDSLDRHCFARLTGRDAFPEVIKGLAAAKAAGFAPIKLNMVVVAGENDHEVATMARFAIEEGFILRLIEAMPVGDTGRQTAFVDLSQLGEKLAHEFGLTPQILPQGGGPARYWMDPTGQTRLGLITPRSQHFCATCNRVRLTVEGTLHLCLGQDDRIELGSALRSGASDAELIAMIRSGIDQKPERHEFNEAPQKIIRFMAQTGG